MYANFSGHQLGVFVARALSVRLQATNRTLETTPWDGFKVTTLSLQSITQFLWQDKKFSSQKPKYEGLQDLHYLNKISPTVHSHSQSPNPPRLIEEFRFDVYTKSGKLKQNPMITLRPISYRFAFFSFLIFKTHRFCEIDDGLC